MSRISFALLVLAVFVVGSVSEEECTGDSGTIEPSDQAVVDRLIQQLQGKRSTRFVIRLIKKRLRSSNSGLRSMLGSAAADPGNPDEDVDESPLARPINKDVLDILAKVVGGTRSVVGYLWHYGFLPKVLGLSSVATENYVGSIPPCAVTNAVKEFQKFNHLEPADGVLRKETRLLMAEDRCGNPDVKCDTPECQAEDAAIADRDLKRKKRYVVRSRKWLDTSGDGQIVLKYWFNPEQKYNPIGPMKRYHDTNMGEDIVKREVEKGLERWTKFAPIHLLETDDQFEADIKIEFGEDAHTETNSRAYFDGQGNILAHMYYPRSGKMHFDQAENFTASTIGPGISLQTTAAHEMGHGLGIKHTDAFSGLMRPYYAGYKEDMLQADDIAAIQSLYGSANTGSLVTLAEQRECKPGERREMYKCVTCPENTYSDRLDADECTPCPGDGTSGAGTTSAADCVLPTSEPEEEFGALEQEPEWRDIPRATKIPVDMMGGSLQVRSSATLNSNKDISLSLLSDKGWIGSFRMFFRSGNLLYNLKHCTSTQPEMFSDVPEGVVTGLDDVFEIKATTEALMVSVNGVTILDYKFAEGAGNSCAVKYRQSVKQVSFWKSDSASQAFRDFSFSA